MKTEYENIIVDLLSDMPESDYKNKLQKKLIKKL